MFYVLSLGCLSVFLILLMLYKKGVNGIDIEIVMLPLVIEALQSIAVQNIHSKSPLDKYLKVSNSFVPMLFDKIRQIESKITVIDQVMILVLLIMLSISRRLRDSEQRLPYIAGCGSLVVILCQRFIWHRSLTKAFKTP
jgi:hypothetical protein